MNRVFFACLLFLAISWSEVRATHIVGAELFYECTDSINSQYDVTLKLYRDCLNGQAPFDANITLFIFRGNDGSIFQTVNVAAPPTTPQIQPDDWGPCVAMIPSICVEEGVYTTQLTLPPLNGGYYIGWARCCRNQAITNLANPLGEGITFLARVPGPLEAACNSMPTFDQVPPIFLCSNETFAFDHSATDPDGDSLVYKLVNPYTGTNTAGLGAENPMMGGNQPTVDPFNNLMGPPPYNNVAFAAGYTFTDPFGSGNFVLDPLTGFLTVTPTQNGIFVFAISVCEYRNGILLSENRRDFQIHIIDCLPQGAPPLIAHDLTGLNYSNDTIFIEAGNPFCYSFTITDTVPGGVLTSYPVSNVFGTGPFTPPAASFSYTGVNPIQGQVCWTPACAYDGQVIPMIIGGYDVTDCENVANVFDTVWVVVSVPPNDPPTITPDLSNLNTNGDTIIVSAGSSFCYDFTVNDINTNDSLIAFTASAIFNNPDGPTFTVSGTNPLTGQVCWTPGCNFENQVIELKIEAMDIAPCNNSAPTESKVYVKVVVPPNAPPAITTDLSGNVFSNDTIFVNALENLCFSFTALDPNVTDVLSVNTLSPIFNAPNGPTLSPPTGTNPLNAQICWTPDCSFENQVIPLIFRVQDPGVCSNVGEDFDTVYVSVSVPPNDPPVITSDLSGTNFNGDTIFVSALDQMCYTFNVGDINAQDVLTAVGISPVFSDPNGPTFSINPGSTNPLTGQVCWTPSCDFVGQTVELVIEAEDDGPCSSQASDRDTVYIVINQPPNDPPTIIHTFTGLTSIGDTIFADATEALCYDLIFTDPDIGDALSAYTVSSLFNAPNGPSFSWTGTNPATGQVCWTPDCAFEGQLIELIIGVDDNGLCNNVLSALDTVYIKISDPQTVAPIVGHDLSGTNAVGDTVYIEVGDGLCYDFYVADQTTENGVDFNHIFEAAGLAGSNLTLTSLNYVFRNDSIIGTVCFASDCSNGGSVFRSIIIGTDKETCPPFAEASDTIYIKVNTSFESFAGVDTSFCEGSGGVQLNVTPIGGTAPYYYAWGCSNPGACGLSSPAVPNPVVNPTDTTTYFVQITDNNGCTSEIDDIQVNVKRQPIVDAGPDQFVCEGGPGTGISCTILNQTEAPGPYTFNWIPGTGLNNPNLQSPYATPDTTTIYTVVVSSANGCSSENTTLDTLSTMTVFVKPKPTVEAGPDIDICAGENTLLPGFASGAGPDYEYVWTPATGLNDSSLQAPTASPPQTTTYFLVAWSNGCRSDADSVELVVHALPTSDPGIGYEICGLDSVQLNGVAGGDLEATYTYQWSPATGLDDPTAAKPMASPIATTTYTLQSTSSFGCVGPEYEVKVSVLPTPVADAGLDTLICRGESVELNGTHTMLGDPPTGPVFYTWDPPSGLSNEFIASPTATPQTTTLYTLTVGVGSCLTSDQVKIDVSEPVEAFASADTGTICDGDSVQLLALGGRGNASYEWVPATGLSNPTAQGPMAAPNGSLVYTVLVKEGACSDTASVGIKVNPTPKASFLSSKDNGCDELTVSFFPQTEGGIAYIWDFGDGTPISNEANPTHTFTAPGTYDVSLTATGVGGCSITFVGEQITVYPKGNADYASDPPPGSASPLPRAQVDFFERATDEVSYFWDFGDGNFSDAANPSHVYEDAGTYNVLLIITDAGGCTDSVQYTYTIYPPDLLIPNIFSPNTDGINDVFKVTYDGKEIVNMKVFDRWGRPMFDDAGDHTTAWDGLTPSGAQASEGVYYYRIMIGAKSFTGNVTLVR
ncbi:MAG: PKD domain-containing protein [Bacteroidota bacterium]